MNFIFTITTHGFEKAGNVEKYLKDMGIPFETKIAPSRSGHTGRTKRRRLDKAEVAAVVTIANSHPDWDDKTVGKQTGVGRNTVNRIRRGIHPLQVNGEVK
jgi:hypothetical protein